MFVKRDARRKTTYCPTAPNQTAQCSMGVSSSSSSNTNDVIDLISDEDDEENESQRNPKHLEGLYELASLRSLIPPNFLLGTLDTDFNFFDKELAVSLMSISKNQTQTAENCNILLTDPSQSTPTSIFLASSTTSISRNNFTTVTSGSPPIEVSKSHLTIKPVLASTPVNSKPTSGGTSNHINRLNNISIMKKLPNGLYEVRLSDISIENSKRTDSIKNKMVLNGVVKGTSPASSQPSKLSKGSDNIRNKMVLNGVTATTNTSSASSQSNHLLSKLASSKALESLKTNNASVQKSITINGFTITSTVSNPSNSAAPPSEICRKLPPANYSCDKCHEKFRYNIALLDHLSSVHKLSVDTASDDANSSSQNIKTKKSVRKQRRSKKENVIGKSSLSVAKKQNAKAKKVKRKNSSESTNVAIKKASISTEIASMRSSVENSAGQSPKTVSESQLLDTTYYVPKIERTKCSPSPILNCETSMNDVSSASDNLVMDVTEENESNNSDNDSAVNFFPDASSSKITNVDEFMKSFKFLSYFEVAHNDSVRYRCSTCNKSCIAIELVLDHSEKCSGRKSLKCLFPNCSSAQVTFVPQQLKEHLKNRHNISTHSCKVCKSYFVQAEELKVHRLSCVNYENSQYQCPVEGCKVAYFYEMHFRGHLSRRHKIITIFTCKVCKLFFNDEEDLNSHLKTSAHVAANVERMRRLVELREKLKKKTVEKKS